MTSEPMSRLEGALCFMVYCARFDWRFALDADGHLVVTIGDDLPMNRGTRTLPQPAILHILRRVGRGDHPTAACGVDYSLMVQYLTRLVVASLLGYSLGVALAWLT
jgi:hypothetical protein